MSWSGRRRARCTARSSSASATRWTTRRHLAFAFGEAALRGATLVAVHSWNWLPAPDLRGERPGIADAEHLAAEADAILAEALEPWRDKYPAVPVGMTWCTATPPGCSPPTRAALTSW